MTPTKQHIEADFRTVKGLRDFYYKLKDDAKNRWLSNVKPVTQKSIDDSKKAKAEFYDYNNILTHIN